MLILRTYLESVKTFSEADAVATGGIFGPAAHWRPHHSGKRSMASQHVQWTPSGVRLRLLRRRDGDVNWLFLRGGPGIGSECLPELVDAVAVAGCSWLVDLPGDGSNTNAPGAPADPYSLWPQVLLEAAQAVERPGYVGHSTGGEYLLATPSLAGVLDGLVLISTAPDASWIPVYEEMTTKNPLPGVQRATARYAPDPNNENLREIAVQSAPWNFPADSLAAGAKCWRGCHTTSGPRSGRPIISTVNTNWLGGQPHCQP